MTIFQSSPFRSVQLFLVVSFSFLVHGPKRSTFFVLVDFEGCSREWILRERASLLEIWGLSAGQPTSGEPSLLGNWGADRAMSTRS